MRGWGPACLLFFLVFDSRPRWVDYRRDWLGRSEFSVANKHKCLFLKVGGFLWTLLWSQGKECEKSWGRAFSME